MSSKFNAPIILVIILAFIWWALVHVIKVPHYFLPSFSSVLLSFKDNFSSLAPACVYTLSEALLGFFLAFIAALVLASLCYFIPFLKEIVHPLSVLSQALPLMILAPLLVLWLGFGWSAKLSIVVLSLFFPIFIAMINGFEHIPKLWLELAHSFGAKRLRLFFYVILPGSFGYIASGLKIALAWSMLSAIVAEWVGGNQGLGFLMQNALARMDAAFLFANLLVLICLSLALYGAMSALLKKIN